LDAFIAEGINAQPSPPADNFYAFKKTVLKHMFYEGNPMEQERSPFLKLTIKVRDKIVMDGL
jgi:UPF0176 protein